MQSIATKYGIFFTVSPIYIAKSMLRLSENASIRTLRSQKDVDRVPAIPKHAFGHLLDEIRKFVFILVDVFDGLELYANEWEVTPNLHFTVKRDSSCTFSAPVERYPSSLQ